MNPRRLSAVIVIIAVLASFARADDAPRKVDLNQNAALRYYRAIAMMAEGFGPSGDEDWELIKKWGTPEADERATELIAESVHMLEMVHSGARFTACDWGLDEIHIETLLSHLRLMRNLARLGCFRAHYRFVDRDIDGAVADTTAVIAVGRHVGQDPTLIGRLVSAAVQNVSIELLGQHLLELNNDQLARLNLELNRLARITDLPYARYLGIEREAVIDDLLRRIENGDVERVRSLIAGGGDSVIAEQIRQMDVSQLVESIRGLEPFFNDAKRASELPLDRMIPELEALFDNAPLSDNVVLSVMFTSFGPSFRAAAAGQAQFVMLRAAVAYRLEGADGLARFEDPYGGGTLEIRQLDGGFELRSKVTRTNGKPVTLKIGLPKSK